MQLYGQHAALLVIDVQNDFADPDGALSVPGGDEIIPTINAEIERATAARVPVVYTQDWHPPETPHFQPQGGPWPAHCVRDTWGAELHPALRVVGEVVRKGTGGEDGYSGFTVRDPASGVEQPTGLEPLLWRHKTANLVVVGLATDYCVRATAKDAVDRGFEVTVLNEAVRAVDREPGDGQRALDAIASIGGVVL